MRVEVVYAEPARQAVFGVDLPEGAVAADAVRASGVLEAFPQLDLAHCVLGVYAKPIGADTPLRDGDRVEIYRPLIADPKEARRGRVRKR